MRSRYLYFVIASAMLLLLVSLSVVLLLPGIGSTDVVNGTSDPADRRAGQLSSGFALDYRRRWWTLTFDGEYAQGVRESHYHSARAGFRLRITP